MSDFDVKLLLEHADSAVVDAINAGDFETNNAPVLTERLIILAQLYALITLYEDTTVVQLFPKKIEQRVAELRAELEELI